jgi:phosphate transport system substrate-binding protein
MNKYSVLLLGLTVCLASATQSFAANKLTLEGSTTVLPIAQQGAEAFMDANKDADISVRGGGSGVGITSLLDGSCDIADSSRQIKEGELKTAAGRGITPRANVVAMDGIAVVVNTSNPVKALSKKQVADIYTGAVSDWAQVGGNAGKIVVLSRDSASGTFEAFGVLALAGKKVRADALMNASNQAIASTVAQTPNAIGYVGMGYLSDSVKMIPIDGVWPSKETVLSAKYPYSRPLFMYTNGKPKGLAKQFIDFLMSQDGQKIVEQAGFVPLK